MRSVLFLTSLTTTLLLISHSCTMSSGQAGLPLLPAKVVNDKAVISVLEKQSDINKDSIENTFKRVEKKAEAIVKKDNPRASNIRVRYIRVKAKPDTVFMPVPLDSIQRIIDERLALMAKDTVYVPLPVEREAKKRWFWDRFF